MMTHSNGEYGWQRHCNDECELGKIIDRLAEYEERDETGCIHCEDGFYHDVLGNPCKYSFYPMCGKKLLSE